MVFTKSLTAAAAAALLLAFPANAEGMYSSSSPVLQVDAKNYDRLISNSNYTSIVEFYAPWCGHCKNLKPAYEKAAKSLAGLAKVAAINCDEESNKSFCGSMGVKGFPTLKIVKPGKKPGRPYVEDYNGERTAKAIREAVVDKMANHVTRLKDDKLEEWLKTNNETAKAVLFTSKGTTGALIKSLAIEFLGSITFAQIRDKEAEAVKLFGVTEFPKLILLPGGDKPSLVYEGELKKDAIVTFLSQVATPNPDPAPVSAKKPKSEKKAEEKEKKEKKKSEKKAEGEKAKADSAAYESAASAHATEEASSAAGTASTVTLESPEMPTESPEPIVEEPKPVVIPEAHVSPPIPTAESASPLESECLGPRSTTCILALLPEAEDPNTVTALTSLADIAHKHVVRKAHLFPFRAVPASNPVSAHLRKALSLSGSGLEIVAINARRGWWRRMDVSAGVGIMEVEGWIDAIRLGEGKKDKLSEGVVVEAPEEAPQKEAQKPIEKVEEVIEEANQKMEEKVEEVKVKVEDVHDEL